MDRSRSIRIALEEMALTELLDTIALKTIDGREETFGDYSGKTKLIVNVASQCGFTPQYAGLEALYRKYRERGFVVLGFPCDQFGHQEPGDEATIQKFCSDKYEVSFPLFAKIEVNGGNTHALYRALKGRAPGLLGTQAIKWNFTKFLVDRDGTGVKRYAPTDRPETIAADIEKAMG
jgi:glutathione peroxidase